MEKKIVLRVLDGERNIPSPFDKEGTIEYVFVPFDVNGKVSYTVWMWCSKTHMSIHFSHVSIPVNVLPTSQEEFAAMKIPLKSSKHSHKKFT